MPSYRFCRSDDVPLLVRAHESCWRPHVTGDRPLTVEGFKRLIREIDLWTSSCMVAADEAGPVAVLLAAKRPPETLIWRIACRPDGLRRGHGSHLLASLSAKLAILGPPRIVSEVPAGWRGARRFLEACGFRPDGAWAEWVGPAEPDRAHPPDRTAGSLVTPVTVGELDAAGVLEPGGDAPVPWSCARRSLLARADRLRGLAVAGPERVEGWLVFEEALAAGGERRVVATGAADAARRDLWLDLLLARLTTEAGGGPVRIVGPAPDDGGADGWRRRGFSPGATTVRYAAVARPA